MTESYSTLAAEGTKVIQPLEALACAATCFDLTIEASQLAHQLGLAPDEIDSIALCRCAAWIGLRARKVNQSFERVGKLVLPVLFSDGAQWYVLLSLTAQEATVYFAGSDQTRKISPEVLAKLWRNEVILLAKAEPITAKKQFSVLAGLFRW